MCFKPGFEGCPSEPRKTLGKQKGYFRSMPNAGNSHNVGKLSTMSVRATQANKNLCSVDEVTLFSEYNNFKSG